MNNIQKKYMNNHVRNEWMEGRNKWMDGFNSEFREQSKVECTIFLQIQCNSEEEFYLLLTLQPLEFRGPVRYSLPDHKTWQMKTEPKIYFDSRFMTYRHSFYLLIFSMCSSKVNGALLSFVHWNKQICAVLSI